MSDRPFDLVYLDTNQLKANGWPFYSKELDWFLQMSKGFGIRIYLPEPVLREIENHVIEELAKQCQKTEATTKNLSGKLRTLGIEVPTATCFSDADSICQAYVAHLKKLMQRYGIERVPFASHDLETVFRKAVAKELPFESEGRNFKDAVIFWSAVEHAATEGGIAAFISNDGVFDKNRSDMVSIAKGAGATIVIYSNVKEAFDALVDHAVDLQMRIYREQREDTEKLLAEMHDQIEQFVFEALKQPESGLKERVDISRVDKYEITAVGTPWIPPMHERKADEPVTAQFEVRVSAISLEERERLQRSFGSKEFLNLAYLAALGSSTQFFTVDVGSILEIVDGQVIRVKLVSAKLKQSA